MSWSAHSKQSEISAVAERQRKGYNIGFRRVDEDEVERRGVVLGFPKKGARNRIILINEAPVVDTRRGVATLATRARALSFISNP